MEEPSLLCTELRVRVLCYVHRVTSLLTAELHCSTLPLFQINGRVKAIQEQNHALPLEFSLLLIILAI